MFGQVSEVSPRSPWDSQCTFYDDPCTFFWESDSPLLLLGGEVDVEPSLPSDKTVPPLVPGQCRQSRRVRCLPLLSRPAVRYGRPRDPRRPYPV